MTSILSNKRYLAFVLAVVGLLVCELKSACSAPPAPAEPPAAEAAQPVLSIEEIKAQVFAWIETRRPDETVRRQAEALWRNLPAELPEDELLERLVQTFALAEACAAELVALCQKPRDRLMVPREEWLHDANTPRLMAANLRLYYGRWLVRQALFDEALEQLADLTPADVAAPASLLFYQSVAQYFLLNKEAGLKSLSKLVENENRGPRRYFILARLMLEDLKSLQEDSLDHIARRMDDIRRRLDLGRGGEKVRREQDEVIKALDKLIKQLEEQQQQQMAGTLQPSSPAPMSRIIAGKGPGEVTKKNVGSESGWGNLPPKEREEALQQIGREFPSHYRDVIEQYFRRLSAESGSQD